MIEYCQSFKDMEGIIVFISWNFTSLQSHSFILKTFPMQKLMLLIDDDKEEQEILKAAVEEADPDVSFAWAANAYRAGLFLEQVLPDLIFLDYNMPGINGLELLSVIRAKAKMKHVPVFLYTSALAPALQERARKLGAQGCVEKQPDTRRLVREVKDALNAVAGTKYHPIY